MSPLTQAILSSWSIDPAIALALLVCAVLYLRGWRVLHRVMPARFPGWRAGVFLAGLAGLWLAIASPLDAFSSLLLSAHMIQHLLLMSVAPPLILLGTPLLPLVRGLPRAFAHDGLGPFLAWPALRDLGSFLTHPVAAWLAMALSLCAWHLPPAFDLALRSTGWHKFEHACFFGSSLLFWWPVVRPFPTRPHWPLWSMPLYLLAADILNSALCAILTFSERSLYPAYQIVPRLFGTTPLSDQVAAGVIMWVPGSLVYLIPAALLAIQYLSPAGTLVRPPVVSASRPARSSSAARPCRSASIPARPLLAIPGPHIVSASLPDHNLDLQRFLVPLSNAAAAESPPRCSTSPAPALSSPRTLPTRRAATPQQAGSEIHDSRLLVSNLDVSDFGFVPDTGFRVSDFRPANPRFPQKVLDLLALPFVGSLLRSLATRRALQLLLLLIAVAVMADGFFGPQISPANLSGVLPWTWWRALTVVGLLAAGNLFCMACPFMLPRELGRRLGLKPRNWPRFLRSKWLAVGLLVLFFWAYEAFGLWDKPVWTAWLILNYFLAAFVLDAFFRGASFCKYVCPIGQFQFINSLISPLEVKVRQPAVCSACRTHDCLRGNQHHRGCETDLFLPRKAGNLDCTFCLDCVRACPHDNIGLQAVVPGSDLIRDPVRSSLGQLSRRIDIAALALVLVSAAFASAAAMTDPVNRWLDRLVSQIGLPSPLAPVTAFFLVALVLAPSLALLFAVRAGRAVGKSQARARELFCRFSLALIPLGAAMWAAHFLFHFLAGYRAAWPLLQQTATEWGLSFTGQPNWSATGLPLSADALLALQALMLDVGLLLSLYVGWRIARDAASGSWGGALRSAGCWPAARANTRRPSPLGLLLPWSFVAVALYAIGLWILLQPMQMRGLIVSSL